MLTHSLRRWPVIKTASGNCKIFSDCYILLVTLKIPAAETPGNTIHWPNADAMLGHRLRGEQHIQLQVVAHYKCPLILRIALVVYDD